MDAVSWFSNELKDFAIFRSRIALLVILAPPDNIPILLDSEPMGQLWQFVRLDDFGEVLTVLNADLETLGVQNNVGTKRKW